MLMFALIWLGHHVIFGHSSDRKQELKFKKYFEAENAYLTKNTGVFLFL